MSETITLDPAAVATSRTALDITPYIAVDGIDWDDARIEQYRADGKYGSDPVDYTIPNRQVVIPVRLRALGATTFETIRRQLQAKVALFQKEMGWLSRVTDAGTEYADVVNASLKLGGDWLQAYKSADVNAQLSLELKPDWYSAEVTLDDQTETTAYSFAKVLKLSAIDAVIEGDHSGRVRIVVDEDDADIQMGLLWGWRSRYYDSASTAMLSYQAGSLTPLDAAGTATIAGAAGTVIRNASLATTWTPVLSTTVLAGTANLTHKGSYRVWARCYSTSGTTPDVRFVWDVGDLVYPVDNAPKTIPAASNFFVLDLGEIRIDPVPVGTHRWQGMIQAQGASGGENVSVDRIDFQPLDDGAGRLSGRISTEPGLNVYTGRDSFIQTAGALAGKTADVGGNWSGAGDTDDFSVNATTHTADRTANSDVDINTGRYEILGSAITDSAIQADYLFQASSNTSDGGGVVLRYVDTNNWIMALLNSTSVGSSVGSILIRKRVAGVVTTLTTIPADSILGRTPVSITAAEQEWYTFKFVALANGRWYIWFGYQGIPAVDPVASDIDADLVTGGSLASGKGVIYDVRTQATGSTTRSFDNVSIWTPTIDATLYASRSCQITTDGIFRQDVGGTAYGPASHVGDLPRIPSSGLENRKVELYLKGSRGDFDQLPDRGIDDISARVFYRRCWLNTPGS